MKKPTRRASNSWRTGCIDAGAVIDGYPHVTQDNEAIPFPT